MAAARSDGFIRCHLLLHFSPPLLSVSIVVTWLVAAPSLCREIELPPISRCAAARHAASGEASASAIPRQWTHAAHDCLPQLVPLHTCCSRRSVALGPLPAAASVGSFASFAKDREIPMPARREVLAAAPAVAAARALDCTPLRCTTANISKRSGQPLFHGRTCRVTAIVSAVFAGAHSLR